MRVGYEVYVPITTYYSSFEQDIVRTNRAIGYRIFEKADVSFISEHREPRKWGRGDSNPHAFTAHDPKSCSSANSDTSPIRNHLIQ
jgi:hypothetical protein